MPASSDRFLRTQKDRPMNALYHVIRARDLENVARHGLPEGSSLTSLPEVVKHFKAAIEQDGQSPIVLVVDLDALDPDRLSPDMSALGSPMEGVLGMSREAVQDAWDNSGGSWGDSMEIAGSAVYLDEIEANQLFVLPASGQGPLPLKAHLDELRHAHDVGSDVLAPDLGSASPNPSEHKAPGLG